MFDMCKKVSAKNAPLLKWYRSPTNNKIFHIFLQRHRHIKIEMQKEFVENKDTFHERFPSNLKAS